MQKYKKFQYFYNFLKKLVKNLKISVGKERKKPEITLRHQKKFSTLRR
jgi:hypothetical protein